MRNHHLILLLTLAGLTVFSACRRDNPDAPIGDGASAVKFSALSRASAGSAATKTQYAGGSVASGQKERIDWVAGDRISIASPQAQVYDKSHNPWTLTYTSSSPRYSVADYKIGSNGTPDNEFSVSGLQNLTDDASGLQWGSGAHYFYGVYPTPSSLVDSVKNRTGFANNVITAYLPKVQTFNGTPLTTTDAGVEKKHVYPQMQYAWMWSGQYAASAQSQISLFFSPMITTFQVSVTGLDDEEIDIARFQLYSENCALQGSYKATVSVSGKVERNSLTNMSVAYSEIPARDAGENDTLTFVLPAGIKVSNTKKVTLTVFAYPQGPAGKTGVLDGLSVRFISPGMTRSLKLMDAEKSSWVQFPAGRKINIDGLTLPKQTNPWTFSVDADDFAPELPDVVVAPVEVTEFENHYGGVLDDRAYVLDVDWENVTMNEGGGTKTAFATVKSYKDNKTQSPVSYRIEYYDESAGEWKTGVPSWLNTPAPTSSWNGSSKGETIDLTMAAQVSSIDNEHSNVLRNRSEYASPLDLSLYNIATGEVYSERNTANCYVVKAPGQYRFPLVYGNGLINGAPNVDAYSQSIQLTSGYLASFKDHLDQDITTPFIGQQHVGKALSPALIWMDAPGLVKDISITGTDNSAYMNFYVPKENIAQGNAVIAVLVDGKVAWSWHIWVTDQDLKVDDKESQYSGSNGYIFAPVNLGWRDSVTKSFPARSCSLRVVQPLSGLTSDPVQVRQTEATYTINGNHPFFQWGRKDPIHGSMMGTANGLYYDSAYTPSSASAPVSLGTAIQQPWNVFITGSSTSDWCSDTWYNLWNTNLTSRGSSAFATSVVKTIYDPSPMGYKVPPQEAYSGFTTSNCTVKSASGTLPARLVYNNSSLYFPFTGYLWATDGSFNDEGTLAHHWSAVPDDASSAYPLTVRKNSGIVNVDGTLGRSSAVGVRPVLDSSLGAVGTDTEGCFAVGILQDEFSSAGGSSTIRICSSAFTEDDGYYSSCAPGLAWHVEGYSTDRSTWSVTAPSWFTLSRTTGRPTGDEDIDFSFTVASAPSGTERFVMVKFLQDTTGQTIVLYISQGNTASAASWKNNLMFGFDNYICGNGNLILGSGNYCMGYDNRIQGTANVVIGIRNEINGSNCHALGYGNTCFGSNSTCVGRNNVAGFGGTAGGPWKFEYETIVIGDNNWKIIEGWNNED